MTVRFAVEEVFEVPLRGITLAVGLVLDGVVSPGMTLQDEKTGAIVTIAGIDLIPPPTERPNRTSLIVDRASATRPERGMVLVVP